MIDMTLMLTVGGKSLSNKYLAPMVPRIGERMVIDQDTYVVTDVQHHATEGASLYVYMGTVVFAMSIEYLAE